MQGAAIISVQSKRKRMFLIRFNAGGNYVAPINTVWSEYMLTPIKIVLIATFLCNTQLFTFLILCLYFVTVILGFTNKICWLRGICFIINMTVVSLWNFGVVTQPLKFLRIFCLVLPLEKYPKFEQRKDVLFLLSAPVKYIRKQVTGLT